MAESLTLIYTAGYSPWREPQDCDTQDDHCIHWNTDGWGFCRHCGTEYTFDDCEHTSITGVDYGDKCEWTCDDCGATAEGEDGEWSHTLF